MFRKFTSRRKKAAEDDHSEQDPQDDSGEAGPVPGLSPVPSHASTQHHLSASRVTTATDETGGWASSSKGKAANSGPLGISVVYTPDHGHKVDIVFVHGLGGTSRWTWSKNREPELFWPLTFLPLEPDMCHARIMTFGYNASFQKAGNVTTSVLDFAKGLLFDLKYAKNVHVEDLGVGKVPLIFVVHSMGGLIVKEAYIQGQNDPEYEDIIKAVCAITFLATPHRGANLTQTLNRILAASMLNSKQYISDLTKNSLSLQKLNEQFRHIAPRLDIVSFYETLPTPIGLKSTRVMVLETDSSVLGYPGEITKALDADHHNVCKYWGPQDPNYITVRNVLKSLVSKHLSKSNAKIRKPDLRDGNASLDLKSLLGVSDAPNIDYIFFRDQWTQGTCGWILESQAFIDWRDAPGTSHALLWLGGGAATGKSVMSAFVVNYLVEEERSCQYFFIRFGDRKKRTVSLLLRSLAYQLALCIPGFLQEMVGLVDEAIDFENADPRIIWDRVFKLILFKWDNQEQPLYWVIDGLDEAEDPRAIIKLLSDISSSAVPLRILFTGRRTSEIVAAFDRIPPRLRKATLDAEGHVDDLRRHIRQELVVSGSAEFRADVERRIVGASNDNFLWVCLAVDQVNQCYTHADVDLALRELPVGMNALYDRMAASVAKIPKPGDRAFATRTLECASCSLRTLKVCELSQALGTDTSEMLDLHRTIVDLCGGFVVVDNSDNVAMMHQTARDYLLAVELNDRRPFHIDRPTAHAHMFQACMRCLISPGLRAKLGHRQEPEFLDYAASSWSAHLASSTVTDRETAATLKKFLSGHWVLTWIHVLAASGQLRTLVDASKDLSRFVSRIRLPSGSETGAEETSRLGQHFFESWAADLLRIGGKFGNLLRRRPDSIYKQIPPFCPKSSSIYQLFGRAEAKKLHVSGLSAEVWDDSLARIPVGQDLGAVTSSIIAAGSQIAIHSSSRRIFLYDSSDFMESNASPIVLGEHVDRMQLNSTATLLATYGFRTTKVWEVSTGKCKVSVDSVESKTRPLAMMFTNNNSTLLVGTDDRRVRSLNLDEPQPAWEVTAELQEAELEGRYMLMNSASHMALSRDGGRSAVIRELRELFWHPHVPKLIGLNIEGVLFRWTPYEGTIDELDVAATKLSISKDGELLATGDGYGRVKLYTTSTFTLLYQLAAQGSVFRLAFSPDSRRLYDIRGYYANAWEPSVLTRLAKQPSKHDDSESESQSIGISSTDGSVVTSRVVESITALAGSPNGRLYCYGTDRGIVSLYDIQHGKLQDLHVSAAKLAIDKIIWSTDGKLLCFTDMGKQLQVWSVTPSPGGDMSPIVEQRAIIPIRKIATGSILQLLFQPESSRLLVHTSSHICTISLESSSVEVSRELEDSVDRWITHPTDPTMIVGFGPSTIHVLDWDLIEIQKHSISLPLQHELFNNPNTAKAPQGSSVCQVDRVLVTHDARHIILQTSLSTDRSRIEQFFLETSAITPTAAMLTEQSRADPVEHGHHSSILPISLPTNLSANIALPLFFLPHGRLVFLSKGYAICSAQMPWGTGPISPRPAARPLAGTRSSSSMVLGTRDVADGPATPELFALPDDWISRDCLSVSRIWGVERSFLCPRNGEVAVVKCAALV